MTVRTTALCLLLHLAALPLCGQPDGMAVYVDLSGEWRTYVGDDPRYAASAFDDSSWPTVAVPLRGFGPSRAADRGRRQQITQWLRRAVEVPARVDPGSRLAVTIGALPGARLFVNGDPIRAADEDPSGEVRLARPQIFEFPAPPGRRLVLAIRVQTHRVPAAWNPEDRGPWLLTSARAAPKDEPVHALARVKLFRLGDLAQALILLSLAAVLLLISLGQRDRHELLWLGVYLAVVALGRANLFVQIGPEPLVLPWFSMTGALNLLPAAILAQFVSAWTHQRWMVWPAWLLAVVGLGIPQSAPLAVTMIPSWLIAVLVLVALANYVRSHRSEAWLVAGVALIVYTHASSWSAIDLLGIPRLVQYNSTGWLPVAIVWHSLITTVFALSLTLILVRRLLRDRDDKLRLAGEMESARTLQQFLLPARDDASPGYETRMVYEPAQEVGGDFHWSRALPQAGLLVAVGDVSGKGLKAAMLTSVVIGMLRNEKSHSPATILAALNEGLMGQTGGGFVTCCIAHFTADGQVTVANAGHLSPYCEGRELPVESGLPLGVVAGVEYAESVARGERFTFVSDGVIEAENAQRELFGFDRTREISGKSAEEIAEAAKAWGQNDDITVVTVRRVG